MAYKVVGGVHTDFTFNAVKEADREEYGPFKSREEALDVWKARMWLNVDNALHRLKIIPA